MLRPDPAQRHRLEEIIGNLEDRLYEATERGWLGEVDGLEASIAAAGQKLTTMRRIGIPVTTRIGLKAARTSSPPISHRLNDGAGPAR
jgi:hypothetical protein